MSLGSGPYSRTTDINPIPPEEQPVPTAPTHCRLQNISSSSKARQDKLKYVLIKQQERPRVSKHEGLKGFRKNSYAAGESKSVNIFLRH